MFYPHKFPPGLLRGRATNINRININTESEYRTQGVVRFFGNDKNYGFITGENGIEYFVHGSDISDDSNWPELRPRCTFEIGGNAKGPKAVNVKVL